MACLLALIGASGGAPRIHRRSSLNGTRCSRCGDDDPLAEARRPSSRSSNIVGEHKTAGRCRNESSRKPIRHRRGRFHTQFIEHAFLESSRSEHAWVDENGRRISRTATQVIVEVVEAEREALARCNGRCADPRAMVGGRAQRKTRIRAVSETAGAGDAAASCGSPIRRVETRTARTVINCQRGFFDGDRGCDDARPLGERVGRATVPHFSGAPAHHRKDVRAYRLPFTPA